METKAREFWIDPDEDWDDEITVGLALKEHPRQGPLQWQSSLIHVIECSAYEKLQKRVEWLEADNKNLRSLLSEIYLDASVDLQGVEENFEIAIREALGEVGK